MKMIFRSATCYAVCCNYRRQVRKMLTYGKTRPRTSMRHYSPISRRCYAQKVSARWPAARRTILLIIVIVSVNTTTLPSSYHLLDGCGRLVISIFLHFSTLAATSFHRSFRSLISWRRGHPEKHSVRYPILIFPFEDTSLARSSGLTSSRRVTHST